MKFTRLSQYWSAQTRGHQSSEVTQEVFMAVTAPPPTHTHQASAAEVCGGLAELFIPISFGVLVGLSPTNPFSGPQLPTIRQSVAS